MSTVAEDRRQPAQRPPEKPDPIAILAIAGAVAGVVWRVTGEPTTAVAAFFTVLSLFDPNDRQ